MGAVDAPDWLIETLWAYSDGLTNLLNLMELYLHGNRIECRQKKKNCEVTVNIFFNISYILFLLVCDISFIIIVVENSKKQV